MLVANSPPSWQAADKSPVKAETVLNGALSVWAARYLEIM
jgi:hypothetical protein